MPIRRMDPVRFVRPKYKLQRVGHDSEEYVLTKSKTTIGRHPRCDLVCTGVVVSRRHAEIFVLDGDLLCIEDKNSNNGTFINGEFVPIGDKFPLYNGDIIGFGSSEVGENSGYNFHVYKVLEVAPATPSENVPIIDLDDDDDNANHNNVIIERDKEEESDEIQMLDNKICNGDNDKCISFQADISNSFPSEPTKFENGAFNTLNDNLSNCLDGDEELSDNEVAIKNLHRKLDSTFDKVSLTNLSLVCDKNLKSLDKPNIFDGNKNGNEENINGIDCNLPTVVLKKVDKVSCDNFNTSRFLNGSRQKNGTDVETLLTTKNIDNDYNEEFNDNLDDVLSLELSRTENNQVERTVSASSENSKSKKSDNLLKNRAIVIDDDDFCNDPLINKKTKENKIESKIEKYRKESKKTGLVMDNVPSTSKFKSKASDKSDNLLENREIVIDSDDDDFCNDPLINKKTEENKIESKVEKHRKDSKKTGTVTDNVSSSSKFKSDGLLGNGNFIDDDFNIDFYEGHLVSKKSDQKKVESTTGNGWNVSKKAGAFNVNVSSRSKRRSDELEKNDDLLSINGKSIEDDDFCEDQVLNKKKKIESCGVTDRDIVVIEDDDTNFNLIENNRDFCNSSDAVPDKSSNVNKISKSSKRKKENSSILPDLAPVAKKGKCSNDKIADQNQLKGKSNDKGAVKSSRKENKVEDLNVDKVIDCEKMITSKAIKNSDKEKHKNEKNKLGMNDDEAINIRLTFDDEDNDRFVDSDEEEMFCSQIFNTTDFDIDADDEKVEIKKEPLDDIERECIDDNDVIIIDDDDDEEDYKDDFQNWFGKLSQSFFESDDEQTKDEKNDIDNANQRQEVVLEVEEETALWEEMQNNKAVVVLRDIKKSRRSVSSDEKHLRETTKKKTDKKIILTDALPLTKRSRGGTLKKVDEKKIKKDKSQMKPSSIPVQKPEDKTNLKQSRKEKLKAIAKKNAEEKKELSKNETKLSTCATKMTNRTRSDFFFETLVNESNSSVTRRSLRSDFKIPKTKPKDKSNEEKSSPSKIKNIEDKSSPSRRKMATVENLPVINSMKETVTASTRKVNFADNPTVWYIEVSPGCRLLPCKKDAPIPRVAINNEVSRVVLSAPRYSIDEALYSILRWKVPWLEGLRNSEPPNVSNNKNGAQGIQHVRKEYKSFHEYFCIYQELLLHEVWSQVSDEFSKNARKLQALSFKIDSIMMKKVESSVNKVAEQKSFLVIRCHRYTSETELQQRPQRVCDLGLLTVHAYSKNKDKNRTCYNFCYVESVDISRIHPQELYQNSYIANRTHMDQNLKRINLTLLIKPLDSDQTINRDVEIQLKVISCIRPSLRLFSSISSLPRSLLHHLVFNPPVHDFSVGDLPFQVKKLPSLNKLNAAQQEAVISCTKLCLNNKPNIALIHGPPGTGKSHVIVNIIEHIYQTSRHKHNRLKDRPKILICAPSNLALDHLVERVLDLREEMIEVKSKLKLTVVRIGQVDTRNSKVSSVALDRLVTSRLNDALCDDNPTEVSLMTARINSLLLAHETLSSKNKSVKDVDEKLAELTRKKLELQTMSPEMYNKKRRVLDKAQIKAAEKNILRGADVICATLSSSVIETMQMAFLSGDEDEPKLSCCIIDEASQCSEPEVLIPLQLNINKLILVGDHKQLPATVTSEICKSRGLGNSLFYRIYSNWEAPGKISSSASPIHSLDVQYRMHPSIMNWPSKYFYNSQLKSAYDEKKYTYPITRYMALSHSFTEDPGNKECNPKEADLVLELCIAILNTESCEDLKIGIITPYRQQRTLLMDKLKERCVDPRGMNRIKINTVDGFQGTEQDVIIMSCVRSSSIGFLADEQRLNVAVTRAKHSLIICANFDTFKSNQHWGSLLENSKQRKKYLSFKDGLEIKDILPIIILKR